MTDSLAIPLLHCLHLSLSPNISPTAAWIAMTSLTPVSHALTDRMERTAAYTGPHVRAEQY